VEYLGIPFQWQQGWEGYITALTKSHVKIKEGINELIWALVEYGTFSPKADYPIIHVANRLPDLFDW